MSGHKPWPPKMKKDLPISERTNESLDRTIAKWMKLEVKMWVGSDVGWLLCTGYSTPNGHGNFRPHAPNGSADRERMRINMPEYVWFSASGREIYDMRRNIKNINVFRRSKDASIERAQVEVVVMWIEAQETNND